MTDPEAETKLDRLAELKPAVEEHDGIYGWAKEAFRGKDGLVCGNHLVQGKEIQPKPVPAKDAYTPKPYWRMAISPIKEA